MKLNILGTEYEIFDELPENSDSDGEINFMSKEIRVAYRGDKPDGKAKTDYLNKVKRHELIHGFCFESGLEDMAFDNVYAEWLAIQFPKIAKAFQEAGCEK